MGSTELGTLAERWNGRRWAIQQTPSPGSGAALSAVSCPARAICMAVGSTGNPNPVAALAELWNGRKWTVRRPVTPQGKRAELLGVPCPAPAMCMAVGDIVNGPALAELWNGSQWAVEPLPSLPHAQIVLLQSVSCTSPDACTAVGEYAGLDATGTVAERWNGATWAVQASPQASDLAGVSCTASAACTAVGQSTPLSGYSVTFAMGWNGSAWAAQRIPDPAHNAGAELSGVSCPSAAACIAVGDYYRTGATANYATLSERWQGGRWALLATPTRRGATFLTSVSCDSASACMAVGTGLLAERWNGSRWAVVPVPAPPEQPLPGSGELTGVSCPSVARCVAVGSVLLDGAPSEAPLTERWNGNRWSRQDVANPVFRGDGSALSAVWCTSRRACTAVGERGSGLFVSLAERWNGRRWSVQTTPNPSANATGLDGASCPSAGSCVAVGLHITSLGLLLTLAEHWDGRRWARQRTPSPPAGPGAGGGSLAAVACRAAAACTAVGAAEAAPPVIERWNGATWAMQPSPRVGNPGPGELASISCPAAVCFAVGDTGGSETNFHTRALVERWNGRRWAVQRIPEPAGTRGSALYGVSCVSQVACTAVGAGRPLPAQPDACRTLERQDLDDPAHAQPTAWRQRIQRGVLPLACHLPRGGTWPLRADRRAMERDEVGAHERPRVAVLDEPGMGGLQMGDGRLPEPQSRRR